MLEEQEIYSPAGGTIARSHTESFQRKEDVMSAVLPGFEEAEPDEGFLISYSRLMMSFTVSRHHLSLYDACTILQFHNQLAFSSIIQQQREQNASEA